MLSPLLPAFLAIAAGVSIVIQQALNANLRNAMHSAAWSGFMSYAVGLACMALLVLAFRDPTPSASVAARIPWWAWSGGLFGAIFIGLGIFLVSLLVTVVGPTVRSSVAMLESGTSRPVRDRM